MMIHKRERVSLSRLSTGVSFRIRTSSATVSQRGILPNRAIPKAVVTVHSHSPTLSYSLLTVQANIFSPDEILSYVHYPRYI